MKSLLKRISLATIGAMLAGSVVLLGGCGSFQMPGVYRLDIQQGNVVTREMLDQLEPGMDRRKVRFILGTPLLADTFNPDRWDYVYSFKEGGGERMQRRVSIFFENDAMTRIEGDVHAGLVPEDVRTSNETIVTVPAERPKEGILSGLIPDFTGDRPVRRKRKPTPPAPGEATEMETSQPVAQPGAGDSGAEPETASGTDGAQQ